MWASLAEGWPDVVGRKRRAQLFAVAVDDLVDRLGAHALSSDAVALVDGAQHHAGGEAGRGQRIVSGGEKGTRLASRRSQGWGYALASEHNAKLGMRQSRESIAYASRGTRVRSHCLLHGAGRLRALRPTFVCSRCDRVQRYCSPACRTNARRRQRRAAVAISDLWIDKDETILNRLLDNLPEA